MRVLKISKPITQALVRAELPRASVSIEEALESVLPLIEDVRNRSLAALKDQAIRFDGVEPKHFLVPSEICQEALRNLPSDLREAIEVAIDRVRRVSQASKPKDFEVELAQGAIVSQRYLAVDSVGLYVPGGKAVYPSSVVMNVVAAQVAGVPRIALSTPAQREFDGLPHPTVLATAALLGIDEIYAIGGAGAVAAFALGIKEIGLEPVRMVTGPGNIYVAAAKRALRGSIGIDSEAGPTEILIIADSSAKPASVAADLISQAEHDENAAAVLVTDSEALISAVEVELEHQVAKTANRDRVVAALSGIQSALVLVENLDSAIELSNEYATEHLSIQTLEPQHILQRITNAGAVFLGEYSPVSLGDYLAGSNHVLPTGEQAKFGPGLGVHTFLRPQQVIQYDGNALSTIAHHIDRFAAAEALNAHGDAVTIRFSKGS